MEGPGRKCPHRIMVHDQNLKVGENFREIDLRNICQLFVFVYKEFRAGVTVDEITRACFITKPLRNNDFEISESKQS